MRDSRPPAWRFCQLAIDLLLGAGLCKAGMRGVCDDSRHPAGTARGQQQPVPFERRADGNCSRSGKGRVPARGPRRAGNLFDLCYIFIR